MLDSVRDGLPARERCLALISTALGTFTSSLDFGVVNVALPTISLALGVPAAQAIWIVTANQMAVTATLLLFATLGDSLGVKRIYLSALFAFMLATAGCALSPVLGVLIVCRGLQGIAASATMVMTAPMNRVLYPRRMLGNAIANNSLFVASGGAAGPTIGGIILSVLPWQAIFLVNVPLLAIGLGFGLRYLPSQRGTGRQIDVLSVVLGALGLCMLLYGIQDIARHDAAATIVAFVAVGALVTTAFVVRQLRLPHPLLAIELLRRPPVALAVGTAALAYITYGAAFVSLPFYLQRVLGRTPLETGLLMVSWPVATMAVTRVIGPLTDRHAPGLFAMLGLLTTAIGLALFATVPSHPLPLIAAGALCGLGFGTFQTPNNYAIIGATPPGETGRATGIITMVRTCASTVGVALVAIVFSAFGVSVAGLWIAAGVCVCGAVVSVTRLRVPAAAA